MEPGWSPPQQIDEFRLERQLGHGASAQVWLAWDTLLERAVALKISSHEASDEVRARFRTEARAISRLHHPNLLGVHHFGELGMRPYLVTELLSGKSLAELDSPLEAGRVVAIGIDLARGLAAVHRIGVLHRDIKPANAFLCDDGTAKLLDFGLAKLGDAPGSLAGTLASPDDLDSSPESVAARSAPGALDATQLTATVSGGLAGTPLYMAPEIWRGDTATPRTDVYSLGALLYELLAGRPPCGAETIVELHAKVVAGRIDDLALQARAAPASLVELIARCLRLAQDERPSAEEICDELVRILPPRASVRAEELDDPGANPYRGLLAFGAEHRALFFGREAEAAAVLSELRAHPVVLVVGESGAGKSSLVRAGVAPRVEAGAIDAGAARRVLVMIPGARPLEMLAQMVAPVLGVDEEEVLRGHAESSGWSAQQLAARGIEILLVVDQLEELWTMAGASERASFLSALTALVQAGGTRVVATLRADFLDRLEDLGDLQHEALAAPIVLGPLTPDGERRAIVEPARRRGVTLEPALVERLTADAARGSLPLLAFALSAMWARREPRERSLGLGALAALDGVAGALAAHADDTLARMPPAERREARRLMLDLVTVERTRARREERELLQGGTEVTRAAIDALVAARLVVASAGEHGTAYEVAHEALLGEWPALRGWLDDEASSREALERLRVAAAEWERLGHAEEALFGERRLGELEALAEQPLDPRSRLGPYGASAPFVAASRGAVKRARLRQRAIAFGMPLTLALVGALAWAVTYVRHRAPVERAVAEARTLAAGAEQAGRAADEARAGAIALFEKDDLERAEEAWKQALTLEEDADRRRRGVGAVLDGALALDPRDLGARSLYADVTLARLLAAERLHKDGLLRALRAELDLYDDGSRTAMLGAPAHVRVESDPPGATLTLARYRQDAAGRLVEADRAPLATGESHELEPGSYLITSQATGRYSTRYPFLVRRGEQRTLRVVLPRADLVPDGMIYVPAGRTLYGSGDDEDTRVFLTHQPVHDIEVGAFLIARTEVTNGDYAAFLDASPERGARLPRGLALTSDGRIEWKLHAGDDWTVLPVADVNREDGERFMAWLSRSGRLPGARLCKDREWERAARGADDRLYPNGNGRLGAGDACTFDTYGGDALRAGPCAVGTHPASRSPFGVEDMAGNVWEWTAGPAEATNATQGVTRGAGFFDRGAYLTISNRGVVTAVSRYVGFGLRVCADAT